MKKRISYEGVAVAVPITVPYERYSIHGAHWFIAKALKSLLDESHINKEEIDGLCLSSFSLAPDTAVGVTQHLGLTLRWLDHIPTGGASGVMALRRASRAIQCGDAEIVACIGADTNHVDSFRHLLGAFSDFSRDAIYPYGAGGPNSVFALITSHYMDKYKVEREDFGKIAIDQRYNALKNSNALMKKPLSMEEYLSAKAISSPIHLYDCVMPCAGADAFLVMSESKAESLGLSYVGIRGAIERHNAFEDDPIMYRGGWAVDAEDLYQQADLSIKDIDFLQSYDDYPVIVMMQFEDLGFCDKGQGKNFVRENSLTFDGSFPTNTSGGQLSCGQAGAAGGYLGMVEAIRQLTHTAEDRNITNAKIGLVSGFGMVAYDRCLCTAAVILESKK